MMWQIKTLFVGLIPRKIQEHRPLKKVSEVMLVLAWVGEEVVYK